MKKQTFGKNERLKSKKAIEALFAQGKSIKSYPLRLVYQVVDPVAKTKEVQIKCSVSVSSRKYRKAVTRNLLKRRMREAYRLQKNILDLPADLGQLNMMILYIGQEVLSYQPISEATAQLLTRLAHLLTTD